MFYTVLFMFIMFILFIMKSGRPPAAATATDPPKRVIFGANRDDNPSRKLCGGVRAALPLCSRKKHPY
jgi:hypothetical protein